MSNLKVERARKFDIGSNEVNREGHNQGRHRGRAASCTEGFYNYRRQVVTSGKTDSTQNACSSTGKDQVTTCGSVNSVTAGASLLSTTTNAVSNNSKRKSSFDVKSLGGPTGGGGGGGGFNKRRKKESTMIPPTKFLLGGNISDPLNLNSFIDEELGTPIKQFTPYSSPVPTPKRKLQVEVLIPPNINDPLNLNGGEEAGDLELNLVSPKNKKRKRGYKRKKSCSVSESSSGPLISVSENVETEAVAIPTNNVVEKTLEINVPPQTLSFAPSHKTKRSSNGDKIVSPVIPQPTGITRKRFSSGHARSLSISVETTAVNTGGGGGNSNKSHHRKKQQQQCSSHPKSQRRNNDRFVYGNFNRYYGYRNPGSQGDPRLKGFKKDWFEGKDVLDIGCNIGHVTFCVARDLNPKKIIGLDIDGSLIKIARKNVIHYLKKNVEENASSESTNQFPISLPICHGPIATSLVVSTTDKSPTFPSNVCFVTCNYVPSSDIELQSQRQEFDVILCLSVTKWVHLNWGDGGLKRMFKRMYKQLRPGGRLFLEAQGWSSYTHRKKLSDTIFKNYQDIKFKPENFNTYLLSKEVGFSTCEVVCVPLNASKGFRRPIHLFTKSGESCATASDS